MFHAKGIKCKKPKKIGFPLQRLIYQKILNHHESIKKADRPRIPERFPLASFDKSVVKNC